MNWKNTKKPSEIVIWIVAIALLAIQVYPIFWLFLSSLKPSIELTNAPFALPKELTLMNYVSVFRDSPILTYIKNSVIVTVASLILIVVLSSTAAYAIAKLKFKYNKQILTFFTLGIMIPIQVTLIPLFMLYSKYNLLDSYASLIIPQVAFALPISVLLFTSFYKYLPDETIEAAVIDGCNVYRIFFNIVFPLSLNTILTVFAMNSIFIWNDFVFANTFISSAAYKTTAVGLQDYIGAFGATDWGQTFSAICVTVLPILIVYFLLNKNVMSGISEGAVKG